MRGCEDGAKPENPVIVGVGVEVRASQEIYFHSLSGRLDLIAPSLRPLMADVACKFPKSGHIQETEVRRRAQGTNGWCWIQKIADFCFSRETQKH